jgi:predicted ferric reductase
MIGVFVLWAFEVCIVQLIISRLEVDLFIFPGQRAARIASIGWYNVAKSGTRATVELLPNNLARITVKVARPFKVLPGRHLYLYMPSVGLLTSHPFSIAWVDEFAEGSVSGQFISLLVKAEKGFTRSLVEKAARSGNGVYSTMAFVEGAYGKLAG